MNEKEKRKFFARRKNIHTIRMGGQKVAFANLPKEMQDTIKKRLAEKDPIMARALTGEFPGIKIDGKQLTRDNLHEFESKPKKATKPEVTKKKAVKKRSSSKKAKRK